MKKQDIPATPELERVNAVMRESNAIGQFIEDMACDGIFLCKECPTTGQLRPLNESTERILARYFDIDPNKVENERRALLEHIREVQS